MPSDYLTAKVAPLPGWAWYQVILRPPNFPDVCDSSLLDFLLSLWMGYSMVLSVLACHPFPLHLPAFLPGVFCVEFQRPFWSCLVTFLPVCQAWFLLSFIRVPPTTKSIPNPFLRLFTVCCVMSLLKRTQLFTYSSCIY